MTKNTVTVTLVPLDEELENLIEDVNTAIALYCTTKDHRVYVSVPEDFCGGKYRKFIMKEVDGKKIYLHHSPDVDAPRIDVVYGFGPGIE